MVRSVVVFFLVGLIVQCALLSQTLDCRLDVDSSLSSYIKEWTEANAVRLSVRNTKDVPVIFVIETTIALDGHALITTAHGERVRWTLQPGEQRVYGCADLLPLKSVYFTDRTRMDRTTGRITVQGDLRVCVAVLDTLTVRSFAKPMCVQRTVTPYVESECLMPLQQQVLPANTRVRLTWKSVLPEPPHVEYRLRIYACDSSQFLAQAVRTNNPELDTVVTNTTQVLWMPPPNALNTRYAWHVYSSDGKGTEYGMTTGYSLPSEFTVRGNRYRNKTSKKKPR